MNRSRGRSSGRTKLLYGLGTAIYLVIIYWLSSQPDFAIREQHPVIRLLSNLAHAPAFAGLAYCVMRTMPRTDCTSWGPYAMAFGITAFLALLDEYHQSFVPGRSASVGDWLLDVAGIVSVLLVLRALSMSKDPWQQASASEPARTERGVGAPALRQDSGRPERASTGASERARRTAGVKPPRNVSMNVLVTDGQERPALAIVRSLGQRGIRAWVGSEARSSLAGSSRYCSRSISYPSPQREPDQFSEWLLALVERERIDVVIPVSDVTTHCVIRQQTALRSQAAVAVPPVDAFERVTDKAQLLNLALISGVPVPKTVVIERGHDLEKAAADIQFPVVVKSFRSRIPSDQGWIGTTVHYAGSAQDLERLYQDNGYLATFPSLIQQRVVGPGVGVFALFDRGRLVTTFAHRRLREKPPSGGVSVLRESVPSDPELVDYTNRLLGPLGWHGVAMVEFKRDQESGRPFLIEVNGRFWGSLQLAVDSGVDFPFLVWQLARGQELDVPATYRVGIRSRWLLGDLDHLMLRLFRRERDQDLPAGTPSRWRTAVDFLQFTGRDLKYEVLRLDDPRPFVYEARRYAGDAARAFRRAARRRMPRWPNVQPRAVRTQKENRHARAVR